MRHVSNRPDPIQQVGANVEGKLVSEDVGPQTEKTLENIKNILQSSGSSLERILKVNIYMPDQADYAGMNEVYKKVCFRFLFPRKS